MPPARPAGPGAGWCSPPRPTSSPSPSSGHGRTTASGRIPAGSLGLLAGREGTGKSSFLIWLAARITTGTLPGSLRGRPRAVIYVAVEDSWKYTIVPRLMAAGADLDLVYRAEVQAIEGDTVSLSLPADNRLLEEAITGNDVAMVALDPLMSAISDTLDTHVNRQVRQALDPLARLADRTGAVIAGIAHFNKSAGTDASSLITASGAFKDVARFIFALRHRRGRHQGHHPDQEQPRPAGPAVPGLPASSRRSCPTAKGDARVGRFVLDGTVRAQRRGRAGHHGRAGHGGADEAARATRTTWSRSWPPARCRTKEVEEAAREIHSISKRTLDRARKSLHIPAAKRSDGAWWISLPQHEGDLKDLRTCQGCQGCQGWHCWQPCQGCQPFLYRRGWHGWHPWHRIVARRQHRRGGRWLTCCGPTGYAGPGLMASAGCADQPPGPAR